MLGRFACKFLALVLLVGFSLATYILQPTLLVSLAAPFSKFTDWKPHVKSNRQVPISALERILKQAVHDAGKREAGMLAIAAAMESTYSALPKNRHGLLSRSAASFLVQKYFTQVHHFSIKGLGNEPRSQNITSANGATISQAQAPELVQALLESRASGRGLTLDDAAAMAATLHTLIEGHVLALLQQTVSALDKVHLFPEDEKLVVSKYDLADVSKLFQVWRLISKHDKLTRGHLLYRISHPTHIMADTGRIAINLASTKAYQQRNQRNPFEPITFSSMDLLSLALDLNEEIGSWQDNDCKVMKKYLAGLDPLGTGRVPLATIYEQPVANNEHDEMVFRFAESQDNLREAGALDDSVPSQPQVLISNYILGPPNCYRIASYYTYCCLNECDSLMGEIERVVRGPTAAPELLASLVGNLSTTSMDEPPLVSEVMYARLFKIAAQHGGTVPLHGRLFAQWLHFAFPHECPYPHVVREDAAGNTLMTTFFQQSAAAVPAENASEEGCSIGYGKTSMDDWTDDEVLPFSEGQASTVQVRRRYVKISFMVVALLAMLYMAHSGMRWTLCLRALKKDRACRTDADGQSAYEFALAKVA